MNHFLKRGTKPLVTVYREQVLETDITALCSPTGHHTSLQNVVCLD